MRVNGRDVLLSEFEQVCRSDGFLREVSPEASGNRDSLAARFVDFKLRVTAAEDAGLDTLPSFRRALHRYRQGLLRSYLTDGDALVRSARAYYDKIQVGRCAGQVRVCHIFKYLSQNISSRALREVEARMDSIYAALLQGSSFEDCVNRFSDEKQPFWVSWLQMPTEFEDTVFELKPGQFSKPFFTPQGIHIVKVLERKELPSFAEIKDDIIRRQMQGRAMESSTEAVLERLKQRYGYTPNKAAMDELRTKGHTDRPLFTLAGTPYGGDAFSLFARSHPEGIERQLQDFIRKSVFDYADRHIEQDVLAFSGHLQAYRDSLLNHDIYEREVCALLDDDRLAAYFAAHRERYYWPQPRYKGIVIHATTKRAAKQARKFLKRLPQAEWQDAIRLTFPAGEHSEVVAEQGVFAPGANAYVDDLAFGKGKATPMVSHPFTVIVGEKIKGPTDYREVRPQLLQDCGATLERQWMARLRAVSKVEIHQEVLKTVNNH